MKSAPEFSADYHVDTYGGAEMQAFGSWKEQCAALEDAFRKLPIRRGKATAGIPYEALISGLGRHLMLMRPNPGGHPPKVVSVGTATKELRNLAAKAGALIETLDDLSRTAVDALNYRQDALMSLKTQLQILRGSATSVEIPEAPENTGRGAPKKFQPRKIAEVVAQHYFGLTGKVPTRNVDSDQGNSYGQFVELLKTVYDILGVDASADSQTRAVVKAWPSMEFKRQKAGI